MQNLAFILGPTAVGKTAWAIEWARQSPSCIINCDSIQFYKELNIGSAKPKPNKYPYVQFHLFNEVSAPHVWTAGNFRKKALETLKKELPEKKVFLVGGSGFYIQALEKGMYPINNPEIMEKNRWENLEREKGLPYLYQLLKQEDPEAAKQISPKDRYRILRSLHFIESEGKKVSEMKKEFTEQKLPYSYLKIGLSISKEELLKKVTIRCQKMIKEGLIEEVESFLKKGLKDWRPLNSVGYKETCLYLEGKIKKEELFEKILFRTMSLAKKQKTWFKRDKSIKWYDHKTKALEVYKELFQ